MCAASARGPSTPFAAPGSASGRRTAETPPRPPARRSHRPGSPCPGAAWDSDPAKHAREACAPAYRRRFRCPARLDGLPPPCGTIPRDLLGALYLIRPPGKGVYSERCRRVRDLRLPSGGPVPRPAASDSGWPLFVRHGCSMPLACYRGGPSRFPDVSARGVGVQRQSSQVFAGQSSAPRAARASA